MRDMQLLNFLKVFEYFLYKQVFYMSFFLPINQLVPLLFGY